MSEEHSLTGKELSDEELGRLLRHYRPQPSATEQEAFWLKLDQRLEETAQEKPAKIIWLRAPWAAAAAALVVVFLSFPMLQRLRPPAPQKTTRQAETLASKPDANALRDKSAPMKLGAAAPAEEPQYRSNSATSQDDYPETPEELFRIRPQGQMAGLGHHQNDRRYPIPAGLLHILQSYAVEVYQPAANVFDIRLPATESPSFEAALQQWAVPHELRQQKTIQGKIIYRLTLGSP